MADWARAQSPAAVEEILDRENKRMADSLASKVTRLKSLALDIDRDAEDQNRYLDSMMRLLNLDVPQSICLENLKFRFLSPILFRFWFYKVWGWVWRCRSFRIYTENPLVGVMALDGEKAHVPSLRSSWWPPLCGPRDGHSFCKWCRKNIL
ncbi:BET1-like protein isoform X4 [Vulpes vulpes]|uniref:BET1-like protein isoform X4 n=1 Tax=Vulpes vulpes TaxID=9627 RepID=A0A3Q7RNZ3_VULVU|nr:BET1-like protein isoform X1 [Vulpes vulpes]